MVNRLSELVAISDRSSFKGLISYESQNMLKTDNFDFRKYLVTKKDNETIEEKSDEIRPVCSIDYITDEEG